MVIIKLALQWWVNYYYHIYPTRYYVTLYGRDAGMVTTEQQRGTVLCDGRFICRARYPYACQVLDMRFNTSAYRFRCLGLRARIWNRVIDRCVKLMPRVRRFYIYSIAPNPKHCQYGCYLPNARTLLGYIRARRGTAKYR